MTPPSSKWANLSLALRSALWTVLLPGVIAGYVPWRYFGVGRLHIDLTRPSDVLGLLCAGAGAAVLGACIREFARSGRGTLAPIDPPRELVVRGLYRYVRNPMYLGVTTILLGEVLLAGSRALLAYGLIWFAGANLFVIGYEEPALRRRFGESYARYSMRAGRWLPRFKARDRFPPAGDTPST